MADSLLGVQDIEVTEIPSLPSSCSQHKGGKSTVSSAVKGSVSRTCVRGKVAREA